MAFKINPGELRHPIIIERCISSKKDNIPISIWRIVLEARAKILNVRGSEVTLANGTTAKIEKSFYIRYSKLNKITNKDRVIFNDDVFDIVYVNNIDECNKFLEIRGVLHE